MGGLLSGFDCGWENQRNNTGAVENKNPAENSLRGGLLMVL